MSQDLLAPTPSPTDVPALSKQLHRDGIIGCKGAFSREWASRLHEDILREFEDAISREGGAVGRGPRRYYVEMHPENLRGLVDIIEHPWIRAVSDAVLGPDWQVVEVGFDIPFAGAVNQPWHRDFRSAPVTYRDRRLTSLAFNMTAVDTTEDMGPFEVAPGTHYEDGLEFKHGMFPDPSTWSRYEEIAVRKMPQMGDISARSALTLHRGTANHSELSRPVLVIGVDAPGASPEGLHDQTISREYAASLAPQVRRHLQARVVDALEPIVQRHTIEGLVMGAP
ncbi:MAG TPA: phytanoyl-CoA dioxygenase family protein [Actinomycetales bacterium]